MKLRVIEAAIGLALYAGSLIAAPPAPVGLWRNQQEGFVIRVEQCGDDLCGFAAGAPPGGKKRHASICGKQMLTGFKWNQDTGRWEGTMQPPDSGMKLNAEITSDGKTFLRMKGKMLFVSKTMSFVPFTGSLGEGCSIL